MRFIVFVMIAWLVMAGLAGAQTLNVKLTLNNVDNNVYIPGTGEVASGSLGTGTEYTTPSHFYMASYLNNVMHVLIGATGTSLYASNDVSSHNITINQDLHDSRVFLGFTQGDWSNVEDVTEPIELGTFLHEIAPTISFGLGYLNPVKILLEYTNINITGDVRLHSGFRKLIISNEGFENGRPKIKIESP